MLPSNGRKVEDKRNYHMTIEELIILLRYVRQHYCPKWFVAILTQFSLGLRASEMLAIRISDFNEKFSTLTYRQAKTNKMIYNEPIPEPLRRIIIAYIYHNRHRLRDGFLFPKYSGKGAFINTRVYTAFWAKWRNAISKFYPKIKEGYIMPNGTKRYRVASHSLRRLHRTVLVKHNPEKIYEISKACHYEDFKAFQKYINDFELEEQKDQLIMPVMNHVVRNVALLGTNQDTLKKYF